MSKYIKNKTVVVTGGADGIGFGITDKFLENDADVVVIIDINENQGTVAAEDLNTKHGEGKAEFIKCDVTRDMKHTYDTIMDKYKYVDILVNCAGTGDQSVPRRLIEINVTALIECSLQFFKGMRKDRGGKGGTIINISSVLGFDVVPYGHIYQASKFAVTGFSRSLGHEWLFPLTGVRTICLCPGFTTTNMTKAIMEIEPENEFAAKALVNREGDVQDAAAVGEAAVEVLDRAASGSMWHIGGGQLKSVDLKIVFS